MLNKIDHPEDSMLLNKVLEKLRLKLDSYAIPEINWYLGHVTREYFLNSSLDEIKGSHLNLKYR
jgi:hypothetical protein